MFPDYTYNSNIMFVHEDGLYISDSHYLNPNFSDDELSLKLVYSGPISTTNSGSNGASIPDETEPLFLN